MLLTTMERVDETYRKLKEQTVNDKLSPEDRAAFKAKMDKREKELLPVYHQVALHFADLHDTAGRMKEKGVIRSVVEWRNARRVFAARLRRRLEEEQLLKKLVTPERSRTQALVLIKQWMAHDAAEDQWDDDHAALAWFSRSQAAITTRMQNIERDRIMANILHEGEKDKTAAINALLTIMKSLDSKERDELAQRLKAM